MDEHGDQPFGVWLVDKPAGPTSHDIVAGIRRRLPAGVRVGHAGTLDPFATGLLVVVVGRATRLVPYLTDLDKTYLARVALGATSDTGDPEGPIRPTGSPVPDRASVIAAVAALPGRRRQRVPALAAVKVGGEPLYRRTRRGEITERPEREVEILAAEVVGDDLDAGWFDLSVRCSKGTYIRQLAADLGEELGCGGYCAALCRLAVGELRVDEAVSPADVAPHGGVDPVRALAGLDVRPLDRDERSAVLHGRPVSGRSGGPVALVADGTLIAIAHPSGDGELRPKVVLR